MIGDSEIMGNVQKKGITSGSFAELARKHVDIEAFKAQHSSLEQFRNCVIQTTSTEELYMILSYSRKTVNQVMVIFHQWLHITGQRHAFDIGCCPLQVPFSLVAVDDGLGCHE
ncbi:unnamed protein product [Camellia sinensis]